MNLQAHYRALITAYLQSYRRSRSRQIEIIEENYNVLMRQCSKERRKGDCNDAQTAGIQQFVLLLLLLLLLLWWRYSALG